MASGSLIRTDVPAGCAVTASAPMPRVMVTEVSSRMGTRAHTPSMSTSPIRFSGHWTMTRHPSPASLAIEPPPLRWVIS